LLTEWARKGVRVNPSRILAQGLDPFEGGRSEELHNGIPIRKQWDARVTYRDYAHAFFIFCYHIKDWIINDIGVNQVTETEVEEFINDSPSLGYCADIANGVKHLKLNRNIRSKSQPKMSTSETRIVAIVGKGEKVDVKEFQYISTDEGEIEAFDLASKCIREWQEFIEDKIYKRLS
jgi:hypothetical protein